MIAEAISSLFNSPVRIPYRGNASLENPAFSLNDPAAYEYLAGGSKSSAGVVVTHENSLMIAAVYQAVSLISGDVARLPLYPFKRLQEDDREIASKHPAYFAAAVRANAWKSAKRFWRDLMVHALVFTNGYGYISRNGRLELYNLLPDRTAPEWVVVGGSTRLVYVTEAGGKLETLDASQVIHVRGISLDGLQGADLTKYARDAWGLALAAQNFESKFFKNGARMGGTLELPAAMTKPARDNVEEGFRKSYEEGDNPFKTVILREGAKFHAGQVTPQEGQVASIREDQKREVASFFNLPPSKLGIRDSVSYNSFEQESLAYKEGCLSHWTGDIADECDMKLLSEQELRNDTHYFEHNYSRFGQADTKTLNESLEIMRRNEIINADEWRRKLNMNKRPDGGGGEYINPNTRAADSQPMAEDKPAKKAKDSSNVVYVGLNKEDAQVIAAKSSESTIAALQAGTTAAIEAINAAKIEQSLQIELERELLSQQQQLSGRLDAINGSLKQYQIRLHDKRVAESLGELLTETLNRIARRAATDVREASKKPAKFKELAGGDCSEKAHATNLDEAVRPIANAMATAFPDRFNAQAICNDTQQRFFADLLHAVKSIGTVTADQLADKVNAKMQDFERTAGKQITNSILEQSNG